VCVAPPSPAARSTLYGSIIIVSCTQLIDTSVLEKTTTTHPCRKPAPLYTDRVPTEREQPAGKRPHRYIRA
jgi:hypothetical protein